MDPDIESYAGKFASEVKDDYDYEDEEDDEIVCKCIQLCKYNVINYKIFFLQSDDLVKSIDVLRFPSDSSIKC